MVTFIATIVGVIAIVMIIRIMISKLPDMINLDIESIPDERQGSTKTKLLYSQWQRRSHDLRGRWLDRIRPTQKVFAKKLKKVHDAVSRWESRYHKSDEASEVVELTVDQLFHDARMATDQDEPAEAEKLLIEILSREPKNVRAYEMLGDLYVEQKSYHQAEEIFHYLLKLNLLSAHTDDERMADLRRHGKFEEIETELLAGLDVDPKISVYYDDLAKVYLLQDKNDKALDCYLKAITVEPNNPRYLDEIIDLAIVLKDQGLAKKMHRRLKKINPENAKLGELKERIEKMV